MLDHFFVALSIERHNNTLPSQISHLFLPTSPYLFDFMTTWSCCFNRIHHSIIPPAYTNLLSIAVMTLSQ